jgi:hypothetical protein
MTCAAEPLRDTSCAFLKCLLSPDCGHGFAGSYVIFPQWRPLSSVGGSRVLVFTMHHPGPTALLCGKCNRILAGIKGGLHALLAQTEAPLAGLRRVFSIPELVPELGQLDWGRFLHACQLWSVLISLRPHDTPSHCSSGSQTSRCIPAPGSPAPVQCPPRAHLCSLLWKWQDMTRS